MPGPQDSVAPAPRFAEPLHVGRPNVGDESLFMELAADMFRRRWFSNDGPLVRQLEAELAEFLGVRNVVAMSNGTVALEIAIRALGLAGEVIVPSFTFIATAHALSWQGITPVFADIDPETHNLDVAAVERMITPRTSGIIGVHLWGRPAPVDALQALADERGLPLLFDAAHAFGNTYRGRPIGSFGRAEVFSFHATKFFNTFEGGAVVTDDGALAAEMRLMRNFGFAGYDDVVHPGTNGKMVEPCAAMGIANLRCVDQTMEVNRRNHAAYARGLDGVEGVRLLGYDDGERSNRQYVVIEVDDAACARDVLVDRLHRENVLARRYFWPGCHRMLPYRDLYPHAGLLLPHTEAVAARVVVLPTGTAVSEADVGVVTDVIREEVGA